MNKCNINGCHISLRGKEIVCANHAAEWFARPVKVTLSMFIEQKNAEIVKAKETKCHAPGCENDHDGDLYEQDTRACESHLKEWYVWSEIHHDVFHNNVIDYFKTLKSVEAAQTANAEYQKRVVGDFAKQDSKGGWYRATPMEEIKAMAQQKKEEVTMLDQALEEGKDAGLRLAARQFIRLNKEPLIAALAKGDEGLKTKLAQFLDTDLGEGVFSGFLAMGLSMIPATMLPRSLRDLLQPFAKELRVKAMTEIGDVVADLFMAPLREVLTNFVAPSLHALPQETSSVKVPSFVTVEESVGVK